MFTAKRLSLRTIEEETATTEYKNEVFTAHLEHQRMQWELSDHNCRNRNNRRDVLLKQITETLNTDNLLLLY